MYCLDKEYTISKSMTIQHAHDFKLLEKLEIILAKTSKSPNKSAKFLSETSNLKFNTKRMLAFSKTDQCAKFKNLRKSGVELEPKTFCNIIRYAKSSSSKLLLAYLNFFIPSKYQSIYYQQLQPSAKLASLEI